MKYKYFLSDKITSLKMIYKIKIIIKEKLRKRKKNIILMNLILMMLSNVNILLNSKI